MFSATYDDATGILRCRAEGFVSTADVERRSDEARVLIERCRARHGDLKILVICDTPVQTDDTAAAGKRHRDMLAGPYDRIAFVYASSLAKMQGHRYFNSDVEKVFLSENAAITWLLADRGAARPAVRAA